jgi:hypothetical protein
MAHAYIGRRIRKKFGRKFHFGSVDGHQLVDGDDGVKVSLYHVTFEDGDEEEYEAHELAAVLWGEDAAAGAGATRATNNIGTAAARASNKRPMVSQGI